MTNLFEPIHMDGRGEFVMPYTPAIRVVGGSIVYLAGVTAAPVYHSHPHVTSEFDSIPEDAEAQAEMTFDNLESVLAAAGTSIANLVEVTRYIRHIDENQDAINSVMARRMGEHRPASTTVEVVRLATDPRLVLELKAVAVSGV